MVVARATRQASRHRATGHARPDSDWDFLVEEKGSVYNEMTSSSTNPFRQLFRQAGHLVYGTHHALSYNAGGEPSGIRTMRHDTTSPIRALT